MTDFIKRPDPVIELESGKALKLLSGGGVSLSETAGYVLQTDDFYIELVDQGAPPSGVIIYRRRIECY